MSALTTRLKLLKGVGTDFVKVKDDISDAFDILDDVVGLFPCTSGTRPVTNLVDGRLIRESDTGNILRYDLGTAAWVQVSSAGAWTSWVPVLTQSAAVAKTITYAKYTINGKTCSGNFLLVATAIGLAANIIGISPPIAPALATFYCVGAGTYIQVTNLRHAGGLMASAGSLYIQTSAGTNNVLGASPSIAIAIGDIISGSFSYEIA
jgi:hypothetical protein